MGKIETYVLFLWISTLSYCLASNYVDPSSFYTPWAKRDSAMEDIFTQLAKRYTSSTASQPWAKKRLDRLQRFQQNKFYPSSQWTVFEETPKDIENRAAYDSDDDEDLSRFLDKHRALILRLLKSARSRSDYSDNDVDDDDDFDVLVRKRRDTTSKHQM